MLMIKPAYGVYWTIASVLVGILLAPLATQGMLENHSTHYSHDHSNQHGKIEVDPGLIPSVKIEVVRDAKAGWNVYLDVQNFKFAPEQVNRSHVANEGHAHLYIDGVKLTRLYGTAYHVASLPAGKHVISVSLHANDHSELVLEDVPISASAAVDN